MDECAVEAGGGLGVNFAIAIVVVWIFGLGL